MPTVDVPENLDEILDCLEVVVAEEIIALREARKGGARLSASDIAAGYLNPKYGAGKELPADCHAVGLACMVAIALHWLACQGE